MSSTMPPPGDAEQTTPHEKRMILIYAIAGSQFVFKVLAALEHRKIDHFVQLVPTSVESRRAALPSGGTKVPVMKVLREEGTDEAPIIVPDSEAILHWLDDHEPQAQFYPQAECSELSVRASDQKLAGLVWYYNWIQEDTFRRSMLKSVRQYLPGSIEWLIPNFVVAYLLSSTRANFRPSAATAIGVEEATLNDAEKMKQILVEELLFFQSCFKEDNLFLVPGTTQPTAADFSVYAQVQRLIGNMAASDFIVFPAIPEFREEHAQQLGKLWEWYDRMVATCPVHFKGKRPPREILQK